MNPLQKNLLPSVLFSALSLSSFTVNATTGYFAHGYGARSKAMAGTGVAFSHDAVAGALNPAGLQACVPILFVRAHTAPRRVW